VTPNTAAFPDETIVGFAGPTPTGAQPFAIVTGAAFPANTQAFAPLIRPVPSDGAPSDPNLVFGLWGNLAPQRTVNSSQYGLDSASPVLPDQCDITQVHLLFRLALSWAECFI
jgi:hypothetical protein